MKTRLNTKSARIAILISLIVVALAEVFFRAIAVGAASLSTSNAGEQITVIIFALIILIFTAKGNDKISYVCCGALVAYFVMDQLFELPGMVGNLIAYISTPIIAITVGIRLLTMIGILVVGALLVEYVNDGSIYNRAFNASYWITILLHVVVILVCLPGLIFGGAEAANGAEFVLLRKQVALIVFNDIYRIIMVVLFTSFAYDSANRQLKREGL